MRPRIIALLAVSTIALVGCSAAEPSAPVEVPSVSAVSSDPKPTTVEEITLDMDEATKAEIAFVKLSQTPLTVADAPPVGRDELISALHDFCKTGKPMTFTDDESSNKYMENLAGSSCEMINK